MEKDIGKMFKNVTNVVNRFLIYLASENNIDISVSNAYILSYLKNNSDKVIIQKDLEQEFEIGKSSMSSSLNLLEEKGYITRTSTTNDNREKQINLTPSGLELGERTCVMLKQAGKILLDGIDKQDLKVSAKVFDQMYKNCMKVKEKVDA